MSKVVRVVVEGPDGGGKSTLCAALNQRLSFIVQEGSGPPKTPAEIDDRARRYVDLMSKRVLNDYRDRLVFDRHPCVSQPIYAALRGETLSNRLLGIVGEFYAAKPLIIYCRSLSPRHHVVKAGENPDHVRKLTEHYDLLVKWYDEWALQHADITTRLGDVDRAVDLISGAL